MELLLLGPVELRVEGVTVPLGGTKQRALLAMLALGAGDVVARDRLVDGLWGDSAPPSAAHTVEAYISRLRRILQGVGEDHRLETRAPGYVLRASSDEVDVRRFDRLAREGRDALSAGDASSATALLAQALELFRGAPLEDVAFLPFAAVPVAQLEEERLAVLDDRLDADLRAGRTHELVGELQGLVTAHPLREGTHGQLMLALYREGRQSEALTAYQRARQLLDDELGVEPGPALRDLHEAILRHDPDLARPVPLHAGRVGPREGVAGAGVAVTHDRDLPLASPLPEGERRTPENNRRHSVGRRLLVAASALGLVAATLGVATVLHGRDDPAPSGAATLAPLSVGIVDPESDAVTGQIELDGRPGPMATDGRDLWVADPSGHAVARIDPTARRVVDTIPLTGQPTALVAGGDSLWVAEQLSGAVVRISRDTGAVVQTVDVGRGPSAVAFHDGLVWVCTSTDRTVVALDARTGSVVRRVHLDASPTDLAVSDGAVWVSSSSADAVFRVDANGKDIAKIGVGTGPGPILAEPDSVWVANTLDGTVSRIATARDVVTNTVAIGDDPTDLTSTGDAIWVSDRAGALVGLSRTAVAETHRVRTGSPALALTSSEGSLWVTTGPSPAVHRGGTLRVVAAIPRLDSIDPGIAFLLFPPQLLGMTNDGLVSLRHVGGSDGTQIVPDLATTVPTPTDRGRTYRFQLRPGIRYSSGALVRPRDFRRALERDFRIGSAGTTFFSAVVGARQCLRRPRVCDLSHGVTSDRRTRSVTFHLVRPDADFLSKLTLGFAVAVPPGVPDHDVGRHPVPATGPYRIVRYRPRNALVLARNPAFHQWSAAAQPAGFPDRIVWHFGLTPEAAVDAVERGEADWGLYPFPFSPPGDRLHELRTQYAGQVHANPLPETEFFTLNTRVTPFDDVRVRRALNDAIDRDVLVRMYGGHELATSTCQVLPPGLPGFLRYCPYSRGSPRGPYRGPRLTEARRLVAASGTRGTHVTVLSDPGFPPAHYVARVLEELGYPTSVRSVPAPRLDVLESNSRYHSQVDRGGWAADYPSPAEFLDYFLSCRSFRPHSDSNRNTAELCDHAVDAGIARAERLQLNRPVAAAKAWARVDHRVTDLAPWLPMVNLQAVDFVSRRVGGYQFHPQWGILLDQLWVR